MSSDEGDEPSTLPRRQLGRFLREHREAIGLPLAKAAALVQLSQAALQRIETAKTKKIRPVDVRALCELYEISGEDTAHALDLTERAKVASWYTAFSGLYSDPTFNMYVELEASVQNLLVYNEIVPGLLQTADYARELISSFYGESSESDIEQRLTFRMKRQAIVTRKASPLQLDVLLHESALHRMVGPAGVMAAQLHYLADVSKRPNINVRVHPFKSGCANGLLHGQFMILEFKEDSRSKTMEPSLVYFEGAGKADLYLEHPDDVRRYTEVASVIRDTSLDEAQSRDLLRQVARSYPT